MNPENKSTDPDRITPVERTTQPLPLTDLPEGGTGTIVFMKFDSQMLGQFLGMGLLPGAQVEILVKGRFQHRPLLLGVGETRIAIGQEFAERIFVESNEIP